LILKPAQALNGAMCEISLRKKTMASFYQVPPVAQTSSNTCWHAAAQMIWYYWQGQTGRQGPMNTLAGNYQNNWAITPTQFVQLAGNAGLKKISPNAKSYTPALLEELLMKYGPLWCAGYWFGPGHIIVLTGVFGDRISFNDPDLGIKKSGSVSWFDGKVAKSVDGCLMYKDPLAY
jgi:ABC-type bacteriocin/lantibiotic exporter with double-glycine peptidase domain